MGKRNNWSTLAFFLVLLFPACKNIFGPGPEKILGTFINLTLENKHEEAYSYISSKDHSVKNLKVYLDEKKTNPFTSSVPLKSSFKILSVKTDGQRATAEVEISEPDFAKVFQDILGVALLSSLGGDGKKEIEKEIAKKYEKGEIPLVSKKESYQLVKEEAGWKVFFDWETAMKVEALLKEAKDLYAAKKYEEALNKYKQAEGLDGDNDEVTKGIEETTKKYEEFKQKEEYIKNILLYDLKAKYYSTYLQKRVPGVEFKLKNKGSKTLNKVEVTVFFKDKTGAVIAEETYHPVIVTEFSLMDNKPLKPNYIWKLEQGRFMQAKSVPSEWKQGSVAAKITDIEFAK